jgi:serine/threonine-protein kinase
MSDIIGRLTAALEGRYRIERQLGEGGMATVYLAEDLKHERRVAIKVLRPELAAMLGAERFLGEIKTTANLQHPHILPLFDSGEADGFLFFVMPYIDGETLRDRIDREKQLPVAEAVAIATKVAGALQAAHDKGIVHRDIKPANILLLANGEPQVADFGIALAVQEAGGGRLTETGLSLGTPYYMSPEQATADRDPDARSDIYSLGCVLYETLTGEPPFQGGTAQAILGRILTADPSPPSAVRRSVPPHVDAAVLRSLDKLPADRFGSAAEMARALNEPGTVPFHPGSAASGGTRGLEGGPAGGDPGRTGPHQDPGVRSAGGGTGVGRVVPWAIAIAAVAFAALAFLRPSPLSDSAGARPVRFEISGTGPDGVRAGRHLALSADGGELVFQGFSQGQSRLYRRSLDAVGVQPIEGTEGAEFIAITPDGRSVAFVDADGTVRQVSFGGGAPITLAEPPNYPIGMGWTPDGDLIFGMLAYNDDFPGLTRVRAGTSAVDTLTVTDGMHHEPVVVSGGDAAIFIDFRGERGIGLSVASMEDGSFEELDLGGTVPGGATSIVGVADGVLLFIDRGRNLMAVGWDEGEGRTVGEPIPVPDVPEGMDIATLSPGGTLAMTIRSDEYELLLVDDRGNVERSVLSDPVEEIFPRFSPDGRTLAMGGGPIRDRRELWTFDLETGLLSQLGVGLDPHLVEWTADGRRVLAGAGSTAFRTDRERIWWRAANASDEPSVLLELPGRWIMGASASPDGRYLAITENVGPDPSVDRFDIVVFGMDGDTVGNPFAAGETDELAPRYSPDGRWLAYASNESGRFQVYVRPFPGPGGRIQVSADGGGQPVWSPDGRRIFFRTDQAMMVAELEFDAEGGLAVTARERLFEGDFFGGPWSTKATYDVHPDGRRFVLAQALGGMSGQVVVWTDWIDELKNRLGN